MDSTARPDTHPWWPRLLGLCGGLCLAWALATLLVPAAGVQATGHIVSQERTVSTRQASWVRYEFDDAEGVRHAGHAMTALPQAQGVRIRVAYLSAWPELNRPASLPYAGVVAAGWALLGAALVGLARLLARPAAERRPPARRHSDVNPGNKP